MTEDKLNIEIPENIKAINEFLAWVFMCKRNDTIQLSDAVSLVYEFSKQQNGSHLNKAFEDGLKRGKLIQEQELINLITYFTDKTPQKAKMIVKEWEASGRQPTYDK